MSPYYLIQLAFCLAATVLHNNVAQAASGRMNMEQMSRQRNQYFLNEFCDLESKTLRSARKLKQNEETLSLYLTSKNSRSSVQMLPKKQIPSSISFGFGNNNQQQQQQGVLYKPIKKQLNCSINIVAPRNHGLLVTINSLDMPRNLTKLDVTLDHNATHAHHIQIDGNKTDHYFLTQPGNSKIGIHLQSFQPIDWSTLSFDILFTVYKKGNSTGCPNSKWFDCGDNICVPSSLVCDNNRNCPNGLDEESLLLCFSPLIWSIALSTSLTVVLICLIVAVLLIIRKRRGPLTGDDYGDDEKFSYVFESDNLDGNHYSSSRVDLTLETAALHNGYLTNNVYAGGFENPIWTNGTLTKSQQTQQTQQQQQQTTQQTTTQQQALR